MTLEPLDYVSRHDPVTDERFRITDDSQASWAMRKLKAIRDRMAEIDQVAEVEFARITEWRNEQIEQASRDEPYFTAILNEYAKIEREVKDRKTISLPYGEIKSRAGSTRVDITDTEQFIAWAQANQPALLRTKIEPHKANIAEEFDGNLLRDDGSVIDLKTGEIIPGLHMTTGETTFSIKIA